MAVFVEDYSPIVAYHFTTILSYAPTLLLSYDTIPLSSAAAAAAPRVSAASRETRLMVAIVGFGTFGQFLAERCATRLPHYYHYNTTTALQHCNTTTSQLSYDNAL